MLNFKGVKAITIPEGKVAKITRKSDSVVLWEKVTSRIPSEYQEVEWIRNAPLTSTGTSKAYIDLGFAFDTAATMYINFQYPSSTSGYPFGAAENSGKYRCMISQTAANKCCVYGSSGTGYIGEYVTTLEKEANLEFILKKGLLRITDLNTGNKLENVGQVEYVMTRNLYLFAQNYNTAARFTGVYQFKSFKYYDKTDALICDLVPCYRKSDGVIGMYDTIRKIFLTTAGTGDFTKGADV